jgi:hypothetical protein
VSRKKAASKVIEARTNIFHPEDEDCASVNFCQTVRLHVTVSTLYPCELPTEVPKAVSGGHCKDSQRVQSAPDGVGSGNIMSDLTPLPPFPSAPHAVGGSRSASNVSPLTLPHLRPPPAQSLETSSVTKWVPPLPPVCDSSDLYEFSNN